MPTSPHDVAWLPPLEEAVHTTVTVKLHDNKARKGDSDFGAPGATPGHGLPKAKTPAAAAGSAQANQLHPHGPAGTQQGGQFIKKGDSGVPVQTAQKDLGLTPDGHYDAGTASAVVAFQQRHGLAVDGIIGRQTALALTGQFTKARKVGPGSLDQYTKRLMGMSAKPSPKAGKKAASKTAGKKTAKGKVPPGGERVGGGLLVAGESAPLVENVTDAFGNVHDLLGKFAPKLGGSKAAGHHGASIPEYDARNLTFKGSAGGSNGARIARHRDGSNWLVKTYRGGEDRVATELLSNAIYREMGARVPRAGRIRLHNGKQALAYPMLDGKPRKYVFQKKGAKPSPEVGQHFMTDALLANWDVAGLEDDNILWDKGGTPFRVDQGGTLEFRAMGQRKEFGPVPHEVQTMLQGGQSQRSSLVDDAGMRQQAAAIAATLTPERIDQLVSAAGFKDKGMRERVRTTLKARAAWMGRFAAGTESLPSPPRGAKLSEAFWLQEIYTEPFNWKEALHPRDQHGKFIQKIGSSGGIRIQLDAKTFIQRDKDGTYRVVRSGGITKGFTTPEDAARHALDKSVKSTDADSVGGTTSHKDFNAYLHHQLAAQGKDTSSIKGSNPEYSGLATFGGKMHDAASLEKEVTRLSTDLKAAQDSPDKYVQRAVPTLKARLAEATAKHKALGGEPAKVTAGAGGVELVPKTVSSSAEMDKLPVGSVIHVVNTPGDKVTPYTKNAHGEWLTPSVAGPLGSSQFGFAHGPHKVTLPGEPAPKEVLSVGQVINNAAELDALPEGTKVKVGSSGSAKYVKVGSMWASTSAGGTFTSEQFGWSGPPGAVKIDSLPAAVTPTPSKPSGKKVSGPQKNNVGEGGSSAFLKQLHIEPGDVIQPSGAGGWKYTVTEVMPGGHVIVTSPKGGSKSLSGWSKPKQITKADKSALTLKPEPPAAALPTTPAAATDLTPLQIKAKLSKAGPTTNNIKDYGEGTVIQTPDGKIAVLKPSEPAYTGYVSAYDISSGQKLEVPGDKNPYAYSTDATVKVAAAATLAKVHGSTSVTTAGTKAVTHDVGPPPAFDGIPSYHSAKQHIPNATTVGLTPEERSAIHEYTNGSYSIINKVLRDSKSVPDLALGKQIAAIKKALRKGTVKKDVWIGRQTDNDMWKAEAKAGKVIQDNGVMSSSTTEGVWDGKIQLHVLIRAGSNALHVKSISAHPSEDEVLMPPGSMFHVLKREEKGSKTVLYVEMIS